ncbi:hypothetical protein ACWGQ5_37325, partial [Streptomyces sp. NPDC055722]
MSVTYNGRRLGYVETHSPNGHSAVTSKGGRLKAPHDRGVGFFFPSVRAARTALIEKFQRSPWPTIPAHATPPPAGRPRR